MKKTLLLWLFGLLLTTQVFAQNRTLSGTVKDAATGETLIGVNVTGKGTTIGTVTDIDGKYTLDLPKDVNALVFSYIGYTTLEKPILSLKIDAALTLEGKQLEETVITAVAIKREKRSTSFATTTVKSEDLGQTGSTALTALQGKAAGVRITQGNGQVGSSARVVLRSEVSISGDNNALIVVDGIPINNRYSGDDNRFLTGYVDLGNRSNDLNPDDIESISVLKGPAATALYGSRAASGVLLITTKKGAAAAKEGRKLKVTVGTGISFDKAYVLYKKQDKFGQGYNNSIVLGENLSYGPRLDGEIRPWSNPVIDANGNEVQLYKPYSAVKNQMQNFFDLGITNTNNISIEGGSDAFNYRLSYGNVNNKGIVPYNSYKRHNIALTGDAKLSDKLQTNFTVNYTKANLKTNLSGFDQEGSPLDAIINTPVDIPLADLRDYKGLYHGFDGFYGAWTANPYFLLGESSNTNNSDNLLGQVTIDYKPIKELDLVARVGNNFSTSFIEMKTPVYQYPLHTTNDDVSVHEDAEGNILGSQLYNNGRYYESIEKNNDLNVDIYGSYKNDFGKKKRFNFNVLGGFNYVDRRLFLSTAVTNGGLGIPGVYDILNSVGQAIVSDAKTHRSIAGIYANLNLGYHNLLFLEYSARNDWSSTLPAGNRGFFYQSGGVSFVPTELFKTPNKWFDYMKIRFNAGSVGKDPGFAAINTVALLNPTYDDFSSPNYQYKYPIKVNGTSFSGLTASNTAGNDKIKPEITITYEGGLDLGFFEDRLTVEATGYYQLSKNQIVQTSTSPSSGFTRALLNVGKVSNKGVELAVKATPIRNVKGVTWNFYLNYAMNRSKVLKVSDETNEVNIGGSTGAVIVAKVGEPFGIFKTSTYVYDSLGRKMLNYSNGVPLEGSQTYFGSFQPKYTLGWGSTLSWKGLSVSVTFDLKKGGLFYSYSKERGDFNGTTVNSVYNDRVPMILPNTSYTDPVTNTIVANTSLATSFNSNYYSSLPGKESLVDASYIKLREVTISYSLPSKYFKNTPLSSISIGAFGRNLKTWLPSENKYADPEFGSYDGSSSNIQGFESITAPYARSYGFDLKVGF